MFLELRSHRITIQTVRNNLSRNIKKATLIFQSWSFLCKGEVTLEEPTQSLSPPTKPEKKAVEGVRAPACASRGRWMFGVLPFFPFAAAIALTLHFLTCEYKPALAFHTFLKSLLPFKICFISMNVSDLYLLLSSSTPLCLLPRWQRGVPKPELLLGAY